MASALDGKIIWLSTQAFQKELVPKPPNDLMPSPLEVDSLRTRLKDMVSGIVEKADLEIPKEEDVLAEQFVRV